MREAELERAYLVVQVDRKCVVCELCILLEHGSDVLHRLRVFCLLVES